VKGILYGNTLLTFAKGAPMGTLDRFYKDIGDGIYGADGGERQMGVIRFPLETSATPAKTSNAALNLVYQAAEVIKDIENQAAEVEKTAYQKLHVAQKRIEELEAELKSAQVCINEARLKLRESEEITKMERSRLDTAEKRMCELEMLARTAEAKANENANSVARIEEAIRTQLLARRLPRNKSTGRI
jgi:DNA repair ATPase RecN